MTAMESLRELNQVKHSDIKKVIETYNLDTEKPNPVKI